MPQMLNRHLWQWQQRSRTGNVYCFPFTTSLMSVVLWVLNLNELIRRKCLGSCEEAEWDDEIFWQDFGVVSEWQASLRWPATSLTTLRLRPGSLSPRRAGAAHRMALYMAVHQLLQATCSIIMAGQGQVICVSYYRLPNDVWMQVLAAVKSGPSYFWLGSSIVYKCLTSVALWEGELHPPAENFEAHPRQEAPGIGRYTCQVGKFQSSDYCKEETG